MVENISVVGVKVTQNESLPESYPLISIKNDVDIMDFRCQVATSLHETPPLEVCWLQDHSRKNEIIQIITTPEEDPSILENELSPEHYNDILMFRGLLANDILVHCLKKRHRVDYGLNPAGRKPLAVPFRGADTPALRAEFSHPDCAMILTMLTYYYTGLSEKQVKKAFEVLLRKGQNAKFSIYNEWLERSEDRMSGETHATISNVNKILSRLLGPI